MTTDPERRARRPDRVLLPSRSIAIAALRSVILRDTRVREGNDKVNFECSRGYE